MNSRHQRFIAYGGLALAIIAAFVYSSVVFHRQPVILYNPLASPPAVSHKQAHLQQFDMSNSRIDVAKIRAGTMAVDATAPLTLPKRQEAARAEFPPDH